MASTKWGEDGTANAFLNLMRSRVGLGEPNDIQSDFAKTQSGGYWRGNWPWCQATIWWVARRTGNFLLVMFGANDAYTVTAAGRFRSKGQWKSGTKSNTQAAKPGWIVYVDWNGSDNLSSTDHVGVVEKNLGNGYVQTLEGNTSDRLLRRVRHYTVISGFGVPKYVGEKAWKWSGKAPSGLVIIEIGDTGTAVKALQATLNRLLGTKLEVDGDAGPKTIGQLKVAQKRYGLKADGQYGPKTATKFAAELTKLN